jgi:hypothetical protein
VSPPFPVQIAPREAETLCAQHIRLDTDTVLP